MNDVVLVTILRHYLNDLAWIISPIIEDCFGDTIEYRLLKILSKNPEGLSMRKIMTALGEGRASVKLDLKKGYVGKIRRILIKLEEKGILNRSRRGRAQVYSIANNVEGRIVKALIKGKIAFSIGTVSKIY